MYGLLLERMSLSAKNGWYDSKGQVYIYYPLEEVDEALGCGHGKAVRLMAELDGGTGSGLIERVRQGLCKPSIIYAKSTIRAAPLSTGPPLTDGDNACSCPSGASFGIIPDPRCWHESYIKNRKS